jgi:predicted RNA-binding protein with PUA-like domain
MEIRMPRRYWLMKCEPSAYTIDDLQRDRTTSWEGVRNYQARNIMRDEMQEGDGVLFYASNANPSGVTGLAAIARPGYPDHFAWNKRHAYFDAAGSKDAPVWYMVDIGFVERFPAIVSLARLKATRARAHDRDSERQPAVGAALHQGRVRHRREARTSGLTNLAALRPARMAAIRGRRIARRDSGQRVS